MWIRFSDLAHGWRQFISFGDLLVYDLQKKCRQGVHRVSFSQTFQKTRFRAPKMHLKYRRPALMIIPSPEIRKISKVATCFLSFFKHKPKHFNLSQTAHSLRTETGVQGKQEPFLLTSPPLFSYFLDRKVSVAQVWADTTSSSSQSNLQVQVRLTLHLSRNTKFRSQPEATSEGVATVFVATLEAFCHAFVGFQPF